jgi:hypothetical protein
MNMNASLVSRTLAVVPERVSRQQSGSLFHPRGDASVHSERIAHLAQFLQWLAPLREVTKDDLRVFGLVTPYGKPAVASLAEDAFEIEEPELEAEEPQPEDAVL